jgi:HSP20 family protein
MSIIKYDPFRDLRNLQDEMNRLFTLGFPRGANQEEILRGAWSPSVDIYEGKDEIVLEAELPGMRAEDVDVSIENNIITLRGERKFEKKDENDNYHRVERAYGSFTRSFTLPRNVVGDEAKAEFTNGILHISLPKREEEKARKIEIKAADEPVAKETVKKAKA